MKIKLTLLIILLFISFSCKEDENDPKDENETTNSYSIKGKVQKGPFIIGTNITINELDNELNQTGRNFSATIKTNDGYFELSSIDLESSKIMLIADGFYFNEVLGELSSAKLTLYSICDLTDNRNVNINVLTHIEKERIEKLVLAGSSFSEAKSIASNELYSFFGAESPVDINTELLDITKNNDEDAILLAASIMLQRYSFSSTSKQTVAEFTQLLANLSNDFQDNAQIDNQNLIDTILHNILFTNFNDIENNIINKYSELNTTLELSNFKKYILEFQRKYSSTIYSDYTYPEKVQSVLHLEESPELTNLLNYSDTEFITGWNYSVAAIVPFDSSLTVKFITNKAFSIFESVGWDYIDNSPNGFTLTTECRNNLVTTEIVLSDTSGTAIIEFYENNSITPTRIKNIKWE